MFVVNLYSFFGSVDAIAYRTLIFCLFFHFVAWGAGSLKCLLFQVCFVTELISPRVTSSEACMDIELSLIFVVCFLELAASLIL